MRNPSTHMYLLHGLDENQLSRCEQIELMLEDEYCSYSTDFASGSLESEKKREQENLARFPMY